MSLPSRLVALLFKGWHHLVSPWLGPGCRHEPSCTFYGIEALGKHGLLRGLWLTARRLSRCHPWGTQGYDPVPPLHPYS